MNLRRYYVQANSDGDALYLTCRGCHDLLTEITEGDTLDSLTASAELHFWCDAPTTEEPTR